MAARNPFTTTYDFTNRAHRTVREWNMGARSWQAEVRHYAHVHGEAKVLKADGRVIAYRTDCDGIVRQRTYTKVTFAHRP